MTAPTIEAARLMGRDGGPALESERLAFEAWMEGHCWPIAAEWVDGGYRGSSEVGGHVCPSATRTRAMWAAWRDRAALSNGREKVKYYVKKQTQPMAQWEPGTDMAGVSISDADRQNGSPKAGDMIAHNPQNPQDRWLIAEKFFLDNYIEAPGS